MPRISNMISQHYRYRIQHLIQSTYNCLKYNTTAEDKCLSTDYNRMPSGKEKNKKANNQKQHKQNSPRPPPAPPAPAAAPDHSKGGRWRSEKKKKRRAAG